MLLRKVRLTMGRTKTFPKEIEEKAIYNYIVNKQGLQSAGREFGISQFMMEQILKKYGIPKRTYTEAKQDGRKYPCNDYFFKTQNHNMAYILGFIAADGYISKKENCISIELQERDKEILDSIKRVTGVTRPIKIQLRKNGKYTATLRNWSKEWKDDLKHYGITPKKTFTLTPPDLLAPEYRIDYIRGYFDGDGTICTLDGKNDRGQIYRINRFEISGVSKKVIEWIRLELIQHYNIILSPLKSERLDSGIVMYKIQIGSRKEIQSIYNLFYQEPDCIYLKRKKEKFETILNIPRDSNSSSEG